MKAWKSYTLHTHTIHSDGQLSVRDMALYFQDKEYDCVTITDHNVYTPEYVLENERKNLHIKVINAIEWTTFYGHMTIIGASHYIDWRDIGQFDIMDRIEAIHNVGGIVGIAHPFRIGSPVCTGCFWQYEVNDWSKIDYIEVWSREGGLTESDDRAFRFWVKLLKEGYKVTAIYGHDWHGAVKKLLMPKNYLFVDLEDFNNDSRLIHTTQYALRSHHVQVAIIGRMDYYIDYEDSHFIIGDTIEFNRESCIDVKLHLEYHIDELLELELLDMSIIKLQLKDCSGVIKEVEADIVHGLVRVEAIMTIYNSKYIRAEIYAQIEGGERLIAFSNPIYVSHT